MRAPLPDAEHEVEAELPELLDAEHFDLDAKLAQRLRLRGKGLGCHDVGRLAHEVAGDADGACRRFQRRERLLGGRRSIDQQRQRPQARPHVALLGRAVLVEAVAAQAGAQPDVGGQHRNRRRRLREPVDRQRRVRLARLGQQRHQRAADTLRRQRIERRDFAEADEDHAAAGEPMRRQYHQRLLEFALEAARREGARQRSLGAAVERRRRRAELASLQHRHGDGPALGQGGLGECDLHFCSQRPAPDCCQ